MLFLLFAPRAQTGKRDPTESVRGSCCFFILIGLEVENFLNGRPTPVILAKFEATMHLLLGS